MFGGVYFGQTGFAMIPVLVNYPAIPAGLPGTVGPA